MEGAGTASEASDKREDIGVKDRLTACDMKTAVMDLNLQFYQGKIISEPHGVTVDEILLWYGDFQKLETNHGYLQWLFPTSQPSSSNRYAQPLQPEEAEAIQQDKMARNRYVNAYRMMLNFYGLTIVDYGTGAVLRNEHYKDRFFNLNYTPHNHIRITRILTSLGEMGLERYQFPLVKFLMEEAIRFGKLSDAIPSARDFWIEAVKDASERSILKDYAVKLAKDTLDSVAPHAPIGNVACICQTCAALREIHKIVPDYKPKARAKTFIPNDRDHLAAQRVVQIEDLSHLTLELGKISSRLNVVAAERAEQKTIETPEQIEELGCLMDELKEVSLALGSVSTNLEALALGEIIIQKKESKVAAKSLAVQSAEACTEEEPCSASVEPVHKATPDNKRAKATAFEEKRAVQFNVDSPQTTLDPERKVEGVNRPLTQQCFSSTAKENAALEGLSTVKDGSRSGISLRMGNQGNGEYISESSGAGNPTSAAKEKRNLSKKLAKKKVQAIPKNNPERKEKDKIMLMTDKLFSNFDASLNPHESAQDSRKKSTSKPTLSPNIDDQEIKEMNSTDATNEGFVESSGKLQSQRKDDSSFESQSPKERWLDQNPRMPKSGKGLDLGGKKDQDDLTKLDEDWEPNDDSHARPADEAQESEEAFEEPTWMKAFRERSAQDNASHT